ncbi:MAG: YbbR-like domain-containing protein [Spirochaetes bacterium]|nr:YbbR-like domain-containing protein [Spirochaetota bacterium]
MKVIKERLTSIVGERDFMAKGICLLLAVILWAFIMTGKTEKLRYKVPIVTRNLPANLAVTGLSGRYAMVLLEGRKDELKSVNIKNIKATVNMEKAEIGDSKAYPIQVEKLQVPEDVSISVVEPEVILTVEKKEDKWVRVVPAITGTAPKGKIIVDKTVLPERVRISGPKSVINDIESVDTEGVSVENETGELQRQVGLMKERYKDVTFNEKKFMVRVLITDLKDLVMVTAPVSIRNGAKEYEYEIRDREVEVYIRSKNNRPVAPGDLEAYVDAARVNLKALFEAERKDTVLKELPVAITGKNINIADIISVMPKKVLVRITRRQNM